MKKNVKRILRLSLLGYATLFAMHAQASGYKMEFQSASVFGDAGDAAVVEDASTNWYNSAGLVYVPQQVVLSALEIYAPTTFNGTVTAPSVFGPAYSYQATGTASAHAHVLIPGFHYSQPINDRFAVGLSTVPAWGLMEDYGEDSFARYDLTSVYTKSMDIAPSVAMKINPQWSVGLGPDINYFYITSQFKVRTEGPAAFGGTSTDSISRYAADDWAAGFHIGVLFRPMETTRIGLNYRSKIVMKLTGNSTFTLQGAQTFVTDDFSLNVPLPPTTSLSIYHDMTPRWAMMGTLAYDQWNVLQAYNAKNYIQPSSTAPGQSVLIPVSVPQNMSNTIDIGIGTRYKLNDKIILRAALNMSPLQQIAKIAISTFLMATSLVFILVRVIKRQKNWRLISFTAMSLRKARISMV